MTEALPVGINSEETDTHLLPKFVGNLPFLIGLTCISAIGGFLFGYDTGVIGGADVWIDKEWGLSPLLLESVVSVAILGAVCGSFGAGSLSDRLGRKLTIIIADTFFTAGAVVMAIAPDVYILIVGRFIVGVGVGIAAMVVPIYLAEVAPAQYRGRIVATNILFTTGGQLISYLVCLALGSRWRLMLGLAGVPAVIQLIGMLFLPESPRWLIQNHKEEQAKTTLVKIRLKREHREQSTDLVQPEIDEIKEAVASELKIGYCAQISLLFKEVRRAAIVGIGLQVLQQLCGINTAMYYGPQIMQKAGFNTSEAMAIEAAIPIAAVNFVGSIFAVVYIDNLGRRGILLATVPIMTVFLLLLAVGFALINYTSDIEAGHWISLLSVVLYVGAFALGMGPTPWTVNSEIYPLHLRSIGNSLSTTSNWIANFIVSMSFLSITSTAIGQVLAWIILAGFSCVTFVWVYFLLPETKGRKLEDIVLLFKTG